MQTNTKTIGIIGFGCIGQAVARRLSAFSPARILYSGNSAKDESLCASMNAHFVPLDHLLQQSDFVIVCCALNDKTRNLVDETKLALMKKTAILINTSRGAVVKQSALVEALRSKAILAAGLDVMVNEPLPLDDPLLALPNVGG